MRTVVNWRRRFLCVSDFLSRKVGCGSDGGGRTETVLVVKRAFVTVSLSDAFSH